MLDGCLLVWCDFDMVWVEFEMILDWCDGFEWCFICLDSIFQLFFVYECEMEIICFVFVWILVCMFGVFE